MKRIIKSQNKRYLRHIIIYILICCMLFNAPLQYAMAGPEGAQVVNGQVTFQQSGYNTTITASDQSIINYSSFNIAQPEVVQFIQPSSSASVLNRILSANPTMINGTLLANGRVFFVNPAGVIIGDSARINVAQLVASGLDITNSNFLNGQYEFAGGNGSVINKGNISAQSVYLVGKQVVNAGDIQCPDGYVVMAAADKIYLGQPGGNIIVQIGTLVPPTEQAQLAAQVTNQGTVDAGSGTIILAAAGDALSQPIISNFGSLSTSVAQGDAGNITLQAENGEIINAGEITAISDSGIGGAVTANADYVVNSGTLDVSGSQGGTVDLQATSSLDQVGNIHADGFESDGGSVNMTAQAEVVLGGGSLTTANAGINGDGGDIIAYSPKLAFFKENALIEAKGGALSGNGGFVELSGLEGAMVGGFADLRAPAGTAGTFLLDPHNIRISNNPQSPYNVNVGWLESQLALGNWTVNTTLGSGEGDITVVDPIGLGGAWVANNLTLDAFDDIFINAQIINSGTGDLYLVANDNITINATGTAINLYDGRLEALAGRAYGDSTVSINSDIIAGSMLIEAADPSIDNSGSVNVSGADILLETTNGDLEVSAREHITLDGDLDAQGNIRLLADREILGTGDLETGGTINATGNVTLIGRDVTIEESVDAGGNILIKGREEVVSGGDTVEVKSTLTTDNGDIEVMVVATDPTSHVENGYLEDGLIALGGDVTANGSNSDIKIYNNTEITADEMTMQAGHDVILTEQCETLTGNSKLTIDAVGGQIDQGDATITITDSELVLKQFEDLDTAGRNFGNQEFTDVTLESYGGYVRDLSADAWNSVQATAWEDITLFGDSATNEIRTAELTSYTGDIYVRSAHSNLNITGDINPEAAFSNPSSEITGPQGGVSLIADEGKIYTEGGDNDTLNVHITGYSDDSQNAGVDLPKHYGDEASIIATLIDGEADRIEISDERETGKAAIVIMSEETLNLGSDAELTANGIYDSEGVVDDRPGVDFLNVVEGIKSPGEPIDIAIYLGSNAGNVAIDSPVSIAPSGVMVVDAYDTVESFGADFINSLDGIYWLEVCSRISTTLGFAQTYDTLPYADDKGLFPGPGQYVLRGETTDVGTGAWELEEPTTPVEEPTEEIPRLPLPLQEIVEASNVHLPVTPELEDMGQVISDQAFDDMQWMANELGLCEGDEDEQGEDENLCQEITQAYLGGAFLQATDLRPYRAATRLRELVEILHDDDGTRIAGLIRAVNEFSQPDMPPSPEQFASIAQSFADHSNDGTHYAAAGEWLDALTEYIAILTTDVGWSEDKSIAFVMGKYGTSITETGEVSVAAFVQMHLEGFGV